MGRNKKLRKALASKESIIEEHLKKLENAINNEDEYLMDYYKTEIEAKKKDREKTLKQLFRKRKPL